MKKLIMSKGILFLLLSILLFSSCTKKIDATTKETMKTSIEGIKESLNDGEKKEFEEALVLMVFEEVDFSKVSQVGYEEESFNSFKPKIHGKTVKEIISEGNRIKEENKRREKEQAKLEIEDLYQKKSQAELDEVNLSKFEVRKSRYYKKRSGRYYITEDPIIEITVFNGTDQAISRAYFIGTLSSPNRTIPWLKKEFNYLISGGLEPGEEVTWRLAPSSYSDWGTIKPSKDAILTVEVRQLDGINNEVLYSINTFGEDEVERLNELLKSYPEFLKN